MIKWALTLGVWFCGIALLIHSGGVSSQPGANTVVGNVASGATDSGNPIKSGGKYNSSPITLTDGQRGDTQLDVNGYANANVKVSALPTGASTSANQTTWQSATGAAPPANSVYIGANASGATGGLLAGLIQCDSSVAYDASTNGSTELKALTSGRTIYVCGYTILAAGTVNVKLIYGTGTACATGSVNMTAAYQLTAQVGLVDGAAFYRGLKTASANALCINTSAGVAVQAIVYYSVI